MKKAASCGLFYGTAEESALQSPQLKTPGGNAGAPPGKPSASGSPERLPKNRKRAAPVFLQPGAASPGAAIPY